jgi:hypothetical protein
MKNPLQFYDRAKGNCKEWNRVWPDPGNPTTLPHAGWGLWLCVHKLLYVCPFASGREVLEEKCNFARSLRCRAEGKEL